MWWVLGLRWNVESDLGTHHQQHTRVHGTRHFLKSTLRHTTHTHKHTHTHAVLDSSLYYKSSNDFSNDFLVQIEPATILLLYSLSDQRGVETWRLKEQHQQKQQHLRPYNRLLRHNRLDHRKCQRFSELELKMKKTSFVQ